MSYMDMRDRSSIAARVGILKSPRGGALFRPVSSVSSHAALEETSPGIDTRGKKIHKKGRTRVIIVLMGQIAFVTNELSAPWVVALALGTRGLLRASSRAR